MRYRVQESTAASAAIRRELGSLDQEKDPELYYRGLLDLAQRLRRRDQAEPALSLFRYIRDESGASFPEIAKRAGAEIDAAEGRGDFGRRFELLSDRFLRQAFAPSSLLAMAGGSLVFGVARTAFLSRLAAVPAANLLTRGFGARALASAGAFALEVPSFVTLNRAASLAAGASSEGSWGRELASGFLTLGPLKLLGWAGGSLHGRIGGAAGLRGAFSQASMLGGILAGHRLEEAVGLRPAGNGASTLIDSLALLLQFNAAGGLLNAALGPRWASLPRELDTRAELASRPKGGDAALAWGNLATAGAVPSAGSTPNPHILQMQSAKELIDRAPDSVRGLIREQSKWTQDSSGQPYSSKESQALQETAKELLWYKPKPLSAEEKKFLIAIGHHILDEYHGTESRYYLAKLIFSAFDYFPGLERLARALDKDNYDRYSIHLRLENYQEAFETFDLFLASLKTMHGMHDGIFVENQPLISDSIERFAASRGYSSIVRHSLDQTANNLASLASSYDQVIAIAKGGLFAGGVADFLGLPVRVIEIHAHKRPSPTASVVDPIELQNLAGKRLLFVDQDFVSGATIRETLRLFQPLNPASIGFYFHYDLEELVRNAGSDRPAEIAEELQDSGIALHFPNSTELIPTLPLFYLAHEKLGTPLGRFRRALRQLRELEGEKVVRDFLGRQEQAFFALNPLLPGVDAIREAMASRLEVMVRNFRDTRVLDELLARRSLLGLIKHDSIFPSYYVGDLARGRYHSRAVERAEARGVENIHAPHSYLAAFGSAKRALRNRYDLALIVGPEGFAYEPIFQDLGLETVAVNIPEADYGGRRSIATFDDLSKLKGKRVLVVEDDVQSGATLQKLWEEIRPYQPRYLDLYLGLPALHQNLGNVPEVFRKVHLTDHPTARDEAAFMKHLQARETVFKRPLPR